MKKNQYITKHHPKNPIRPMATRHTERSEKLAMVGEVLMTACLGVGCYALVVVIFGVTA